MADGRKNNGCKPGENRNQGRKTKAQELGLPKLIEDVVGEEGKRNLIALIYEKAMTGDFRFVQLLMNYTYGKPVEVKEIKQELDGYSVKVISAEDAEIVEEVKLIRGD